MAIMLRSYVTGKFNGKPVAFYIDHSNRSVSDATEAVYRHLTGMTLCNRRRDWSSHQVKGQPITLILHHAKFGNEKLEINIIGRSVE